jgi:hypothetical protein
MLESSLMTMTNEMSVAAKAHLEDFEHGNALLRMA